MVVHVDNINAAKVAQFEAARARFVEQLGKRGLDDHRGHYFKVGATTFFSLAPMEDFAGLHALISQRRAAVAKMAGTVEEYDRLSDEGLVFPHANEIWSARPDLAYLPTGLSLDHAVDLVVEQLHPMCDAGALWKPVAQALTQAHYPLERRTYFSAYGTGKMLSFWLAPDVHAPPDGTLEDAVAQAAGTEQAAALLRGVASCVIHSQRMPVRFMRQMTVATTSVSDAGAD